MTPSKQRNPRRSAAQWHQIVEAQQASGLSAPKFCREKDISYPSFMNWKKKLVDTSIRREVELPTFIELTPQPQPAPSTDVSSDAQPLNIELDLGAGIQLRITRAG